MGRIFSLFSNLNHENEAEVSQNFVIPLFTQFLEFQLLEIKPERMYPVKNLYKGVKKIGTTKQLTYKPDYVVCIDGNVDDPKFLIDSKGPNEKIDDHLDQLKSYAAGVGVNLLVITNGKSFRVYDVNVPIFNANTIEDLDTKFKIVQGILSRKTQVTFTVPEIIKKIDIDVALDKTPQQEFSRKEKQIRLEISDFTEYLNNVVTEFCDWHIPAEFPSFPKEIINKYPPDQLHTLQKYQSVHSSLEESECKLEDLLMQSVRSTVVVLGHSGIGKTTLLKYMANAAARNCLALQSNQIPIYVSLRNYGINQGLRSLISSSLARRGFTISDNTLPTLLMRNTLFILLDGHDEVHQNYIDDLDKEIDEVMKLRAHTIIITSRQVRKPNIPRATYYVIQPLNQDRIYVFLGRQLGNDQYKFVCEVNRLGLNDYLRNTLLLTFLILLYKQKEELPFSRARIIGSVIEKIRNWESHKFERSTVVLEWDTIESILSELAFTSVEGNHDTTITQEQVDDILIPAINTLEEKRAIQRGVDKNQLVEHIAFKGFLEIENNVTYFRHRVFLNYFASKSFALRHSQNMINLDDFIKQPPWEQIVTLASAHLRDSTSLINTIAKSNLFLAATCLIESQYTEEAVVQSTIDRLAERCESGIGEVRARSLWLLKRIARKYTTDIFHKLVHDCEYLDVRKTALEEIAREGSKEARDVIDDYLDWDEGSFSAGSSQGSVAIALSFFGQSDQIKIIDIWKKKPDIFTGMDCRTAMLKIVREGRLTQAAKKKLLDFYLEKDTDFHKFSKERGLADILIEISDEDFVPPLIASYKKVDLLHHTYGTHTKEILASYSSERVTEQLVDAILHNHEDVFMRQECCAVLSSSKATIPLSVFQGLLNDTLPGVRYHAIEGLQRYPANQIREDLTTRLEDEHGFVQSKVFEVLIEKRLLHEIIQNGLFPKRISDLSIKAILKCIRKYRLLEMGPLIERLRPYYESRPIDRLDIAHTYCIIDEYSKAKEIVTEFFHNSKVYGNIYTMSDLAEISIFFDAEFALEIINRILKTIEETQDGAGYLEDKCIESLEKIPSARALTILKTLAERYIKSKKHHVLGVERTLRAINQKITKQDEEWYSNFISTHPELERFDLSRAVEGLGIVGSIDAIPTLQRIATSNKQFDYIVDACYASIENICRNAGMLIEVTEQDVFDGKS